MIPSSIPHGPRRPVRAVVLLVLLVLLVLATATSTVGRAATTPDVPVPAADASRARALFIELDPLSRFSGSDDGIERFQIGFGWARAGSHRQWTVPLFLAQEGEPGADVDDTGPRRCCDVRIASVAVQRRRFGDARRQGLYTFAQLLVQQSTGVTLESFERDAPRTRTLTRLGGGIGAGILLRGGRRGQFTLGASLCLNGFFDDGVPLQRPFVEFYDGYDTNRKVSISMDLVRLGYRF